MDTNLFWNLRGNYLQRKETLQKCSREYLESSILDAEYNDFLKVYADYSDDTDDKHGYGKRLPYLGWYWRHLNFSEGKLPIGRGDFVGFIANNKWDYPERETTQEEFAKIMEFIDQAINLSQAGGLMSEIKNNTFKKLDELWDYLQELSI